MADCTDLDLFSKQKAKFFDPSYSGRYANLSLEILPLLNQLNRFEWQSTRSAIARGFFGPFDVIWSKCNQSQFDIKSGLLKGLVNSYMIETDQLKKWELERKITGALEQCQ